MKSATLLPLFLAVFLVESVRCGLKDKMCPNVPCPAGKVCVGLGYMRLCEKPGGEGHRCVRETTPKNEDGSYDGAPPCEDGLTCPDNATPRCKK